MNISIAMSVYNGSRFLKEQIESILCDLVEGDEIILVNDASTDNSESIIKTINSPFIKYFENRSNLGITSSFEKAMRMASNEYIFLCDQDDIWIKGRREIVTHLFKNNPKALIVMSDAEVIDETGLLLAPSFQALRGGFKPNFTPNLIKNRYLGCSMSFRRKLLDYIIPIPREVPMHDIWIGAIGCILGQVCYYPYPLIKYRRHANNVSPSTRRSFIQMTRWRINLLFLVAFRIFSIKLNFKSSKL